MGGEDMANPVSLEELVKALSDRSLSLQTIVERLAPAPSKIDDDSAKAEIDRYSALQMKRKAIRDAMKANEPGGGG